MNLQKMLAELREQKAAGLASMKALHEKAAGESRDFNEDEQKEYEKLAAADTAVGKQLDRVLDLLQRDAATAKAFPTDPTGGSNFGKTLPALPRDNESDAKERKSLLGRVVLCMAASKGHRGDAAALAEKHFGGGSLAVKTITAGAGANSVGVMIPQDLAAEVVDFYRPATTFRKNVSRVVDMPTGKYEIPRSLTGASANYGPEGGAIGVSQGTMDKLNLVAKTLAALVPVSLDAVNFTSGRSESLVDADVKRALGVREDATMLRGTAGGDNPTGIRFQVHASHVLAVPAGTSPTAAVVRTQLGRAKLALRNANSPMTAVRWFLTPGVLEFLENLENANGQKTFPKLEEGILSGFPFEVTTQIPSTLGVGANESELLLVDMDEVVIGDHGGLTIDVSSEATYNDGAVDRHTFQRREMLVRAVAQHDMILRNVRAGAALTGVQWTPS